jgi:hypothetical protein
MLSFINAIEFDHLFGRVEHLIQRPLVAPSTLSLTNGTPCLRPVTVPTHPAPTSSAPAKITKIFFITVCNHIRLNRQARIPHAHEFERAGPVPSCVASREGTAPLSHHSGHRGGAGPLMGMGRRPNGGLAAPP